MKFRSKGIISGSIVAFFVLFFLGILINEWTLYFFLLVLAIYIIAIFFRYNNYIKLDDDGITQIKYNLLLKRKITTITYKEISDISLEKNNMLSQENIWKHQICASSWEEIKFWKIFHFKQFKSILKDKTEGKDINMSSDTNDYIKYIDKTSSNYFTLTSNKSLFYEITTCIIFCVYLIVYSIKEWWNFSKIIVWPNMIIPIAILVIFIWIKIYNSIKERPFVMLSDNSIIIGQYTKSKYNIQKIPYSNIEKIEVDTPRNNTISNMLNGTSFYIILKNKKDEKEIQWLKNWNEFIEALKKKWIDADYVS